MTGVTPIKADIAALKAVQTLDKQIYDLGQSLVNLPTEIKELQAGLDIANGKYAQAEDSVKHAKASLKNKEVELNQKEEQVLKLLGQLNLVKTNKEYTAIQTEVASKKAEMSMLEEEILILMDEVEGAAAIVAEHKKELEEEKKKLDIQEAEVKTKCDGDQKIRESLLSERKMAVESVSKETREMYERILEKKNGVALVVLTGDTCTACHYSLRPQVEVEIRMMQSLVLCDRCSRILCYAD